MRKNTLLGAGSFAALALSLFFLASAAAHAQQMYRWVDQNGRVTYSQQPPPAGTAKNVEQKRLGSSSGGSATVPYAVQVAMRDFPVTLYTAPECGAACRDARDSLQKRGIPFKEVSVTDEAGVRALQQLTGKNQVPALQVGKQVLSGFEPAGWKSVLDAARYPASITAPVTSNTAAPAPTKTPAAGVRLFASVDCGLPCASAKDLLAARGVAFQEISLQSQANIDELKKIAGDSNVVPVLVIGSTSLRGFDAQQYHAALDSAGYPRQQASN